MDAKKKAPAKAKKSARVAVKGVTWKRSVAIPADKYQAVARTLLAVLPRQPITFTQLVELVARRLPRFDGSVAWYTIAIARELEAQGKLTRHPKPVRYSRPPKGRR